MAAHNVTLPIPPELHQLIAVADTLPLMRDALGPGITLPVSPNHILELERLKASVTNTGDNAQQLAMVKLMGDCANSIQQSKLNFRGAHQQRD